MGVDVCRRHWIPITVAVMVLTVPTMAQHAPDDLTQRLRMQRQTLVQLQSDLEEATIEATQIRRRERSAAKRAVHAANRVSMIEHAIVILTGTASELSADIRIVTAHRDSLTHRIQLRRNIMERRVRLLYMRGRRQPYQRALLASSLLHWFAARHYMTTLNRRDRIDVDHLARDHAKLAKTLVLYEEQKETLDTLVTRRKNHRRKLVAVRGESRKHLRKIRRSRKLADRATVELAAQRENSRKRIERHLTDLTKAGARMSGGPELGGASSASATDFSGYRGRLPWPVRGRVLTRFGRSRDRTSKTWTRNRGIDIGTPAGTDVLAVAGGRVVMVSWMRGYGTFLIISHSGNYYTLYAHLRNVRIRRNDQVRQGQVIGVSGKNAIGKPRLHFQLLAGKRALNPLDWLTPQAGGAS
jgi:murein hydrolase activator